MDTKKQPMSWAQRRMAESENLKSRAAVLEMSGFTNAEIARKLRVSKQYVGQILPRGLKAARLASKNPKIQKAGKILPAGLTGTNCPIVSPMEPILVITNFPDRASALALAQKLVDERLAACVNVLADCTSVYRWQEKIENASEVPVLIKTLAHHYPRVEQAVKAMHPYELPEIIAVPISNGLPAYMQWMAAETLAFPDKT